MGDVVQLLEHMCELAKQGVRLPDMSRQKALERAQFGLALRESRLQSADELLEAVDLLRQMPGVDEVFNGDWQPLREELWRKLQVLFHAGEAYRLSVKAEADFKRTVEAQGVTR